YVRVFYKAVVYSDRRVSADEFDVRYIWMSGDNLVHLRKRGWPIPMISSRRIIDGARRTLQLFGEGSFYLARDRHAFSGIDYGLQAANFIGRSPIACEVLHAVQNRAVAGAPAEIAVEQILNLLLTHFAVLVRRQERSHV